MPNLKRYRPQDLDKSQVRALISLLFNTWPQKASTVDEYESDFWPRCSATPGMDIMLLWEDDRLIGHTQTFPRSIRTQMGEMDVLALAGVCVEPDQRGKGFGKLLIQEAFKPVDQGTYVVSLFQTGIPDFYRPFGAVTVHNDFTNGFDENSSKASPWWDPHIMIYPAIDSWPAGPIDLNGGGY